MIDLSKCKTYDDWRRAGYQVIRGEKSVGRIDGECVFSPNQIKKISYVKNYRCLYTYDYDEDEYDFDLVFGLPGDR